MVYLLFDLKVYGSSKCSKRRPPLTRESKEEKKRPQDRLIKRYSIVKEHYPLLRENYREAV